MPNYHNLEHSSCVSQCNFWSLTKFCWIQGQGRVHKSSSVALPCVVLFGQGGTQITDCSCCHRASAEATWRMLLLISLRSSEAAADPKNYARTNALSRSHAFQKFWGILLVCLKVLTSFPEDYGRITIFQVQWVVIVFTVLLRLSKRNVKRADVWSVENIKYLSGTVIRSYSYFSCLEVNQSIVVFNVQK